MNAKYCPFGDTLDVNSVISWLSWPCPSAQSLASSLESTTTSRGLDHTDPVSDTTYKLSTPDCAPGASAPWATKYTTEPPSLAPRTNGCTLACSPAFRSAERSVSSHFGMPASSTI